MKFKKTLAAALALSLLVSAGSTTAFAAEQTNTEKTETSIFVSTDRHSYYDAEWKIDIKHGNNLTNVLKLIQADDSVTQPTVGVIGGDLVGDGPDAGKEDDGSSKGQPFYSIDDPNEEFASVYGPDFKTYYTYGSHDNSCTSDYASTWLSGPAEENGYYLYGITYAQMIYATDAQVEADREADALIETADLEDKNGMSAETAAAKFLAWLDSVDDNKPIIVMSHVPMHVNRADNLGASTWNAAFEKAAKTHDVIVLWGHNHSEETHRDKYGDRAYYIVPKGSEMPVQGSEKAENETIKLAYTYANAGYITMGYGSLVTFTDNESDGNFDNVQIKRYNLGLALHVKNEKDMPFVKGHEEGGVAGPDAAFGETGIASPYNQTLTQWVPFPETVTLTANGKAQTAYEDTDFYTVEGGQATEAGSYTATFTLKDGCKWSDGTSDPYELTWTVKAAAAADKVVKGKTYKVSGQSYKVTKVAGKNAGTVTFTKAKNAKKVTVPKTVKLKDGKTYQVTAIAAKAFTGKKIRTVIIDSNVKTIQKNAFAGSKATNLTVKTKSLTKASVKGSLKSSKVKKIIVSVGSKKVNKTYAKKYAKIFTKKNAGKQAAVK